MKIKKSINMSHELLLKKKSIKNLIKVCKVKKKTRIKGWLKKIIQLKTKKQILKDSKILEIV